MIEAEQLCFDYPGAFRLRVKRLCIAKGEKVAIIGASGSGKTTLISLLAGILPVARGKIVVDGTRLHECDDTRRRAFRVSKVGFIFQDFELIDYLPVRDNILLPFYVNLSLSPPLDMLERVEKLAAEVGLEGKLDRHPLRLSQGEKQRVAICRALVARPSIVIADEPTGNLDPETTAAILDCVFERVENGGNTFVMVTHDHGLLNRFDRVIDMASLEEGLGI